MAAPAIPAERFSFLPLVCEMLLKVQVGDTQELLRLAIQERLASATEHVDSLSGSQLTADQQAELLAGLQLLLQRKSARLGSFQAQEPILRFRAGNGAAPNGHAMDTS